MLKKFAFFALLCIAFMLAACKSAPLPETPAPPVVQEPVKPVEPEPAESVVPDAEAIARNTDALAQIEAARNKALAAEADTLCPDQLALLDGDYNVLKDGNTRNPESPAAADKGPDLVGRYEALEKAARALTAKNAVDNLDLAQYAPDDYQKGEDALNTLEAADPQKEDAKTLKDTAETAATAYAAVLAAGVGASRDKAVDAGAGQSLPEDLAALDASLDELSKQYAAAPEDPALLPKGEDMARQYQALEQTALAGSVQAVRGSAVQAKARADSIKASVMEAVAYGTAAAALAQGDSALDSGDYKTAAADFQNARDTFQEVYDRVSVTREHAQEAMQAAAQQTQGAEAFALEADETLAGNAGTEEE